MRKFSSQVLRICRRIFIDHGALCFHFKGELQAAIPIAESLIFRDSFTSFHVDSFFFFPQVIVLGCTPKTSLTLPWKIMCYPVNKQCQANFTRPIYKLSFFTASPLLPIISNIKVPSLERIIFSAVSLLRRITSEQPLKHQSGLHFQISCKEQNLRTGERSSSKKTTEPCLGQGTDSGCLWRQ